MIKSRLVSILCALVTILFLTSAQELLIGDNMILQRDSNSTKLFGSSTGTEVTIIIKNKQVEVDKYSSTTKDNKWIVNLKLYQASGPYTIEVTTKDKHVAVYSNIYFGDVYFCSGQSNMGFTTNRAINADKEIADSINYPNLHVFQAQRLFSKTPQEKVKGHWSQSSPSVISGFSAVCYFFGRDIYKANEGKLAIGLIESDWGGTRIEAWMSKEAMKVCGDDGRQHKDQQEASALWNAMVNPFIHYNVRGFLWYQAEANVGQPERYKCTFPEMIKDWRKMFNVKDAPFYFVQLAGHEPNGDNLAKMRLSQTSVLNLPNTGFATAMDVGNKKDIHPKLKQIVGERLSRVALHEIYGRKDVLYKGPTLKDRKIVGNKLYLHFDNVFGGLYAFRTENSTKGCHAETLFTAKDASGNVINLESSMVDGDAVTITMNSGGSQKISSLGYAMFGFPECVLYDKKSNLPASPFLIQFSGQDSMPKVSTSMINK